MENSKWKKTNNNYMLDLLDRSLKIAEAITTEKIKEQKNKLKAIEHILTLKVNEQKDR